jgi:GntR family transcriptional regulator, rspAB operon transcriptional repressor
MSQDTVAAAARAYETIKGRIIDCTYAAGAKISEARLVAELGVGRSPIRSALARLRSEGWVEVSPQSGSYVKRLSAQEMQEIFELRALLETHAARRAASNLTDAQRRELALGLKKMRLLEIDGHDPFVFEEFDAFDTLVHTTIYRASGNALMGAVLSNLLEKAQWLKKSTPTTSERMKTWLLELEHIIGALQAGDADRAAQCLREHIGQAADFEMQSASRRSTGADTGPQA